MRICSPQLGLNPASVLGGEVFDRETLLGLAKRGVKVEIILPKDKKHDRDIKNWNVTCIPITHFPAILGNFLYLPSLFKVNKKSKFQILRIHQPQFLGIGCLIFKLFNKNVKLIATYHQFGETNFGPFSKFISNKWDHIVCDSQSVKNLIYKKYNIALSKITVVHNGAPEYLRPTSRDKKLEKKLKLKGKIVLLFMGLFIDRKNPLFLLDVLFKLKKTRSDLVLLLWGAGPLKNEMMAKARKLNLADQIRVIDPVYGPEKNKIHNLADIFVHPATDEGFALAPLEAMACAKPIVMSKAFSANEAIDDGKNGYLCNSNDLNHWNNKLNKLINNQQLRRKMGHASLKKIKKEFQWQFAVDKHLTIFKKLAQR